MATRKNTLAPATTRGRATKVATTAAAKPKATARKVATTALPKTAATAAAKVVKAAPAKKGKVDSIKWRGYVIPVTRKSSDDDTNVPTLAIKTLADLTRLFEKLPKGCTWAGEAGGITLYNKTGAMIAEVRKPTY